MQVGLVLDEDRPPAAAPRRGTERLERLLEAAGVEVAEAMVGVGWNRVTVRKWTSQDTVQ